MDILQNKNKKYKIGLGVLFVGVLKGTVYHNIYNKSTWGKIRFHWKLCPLTLMKCIICVLISALVIAHPIHLY